MGEGEARGSIAFFATYRPPVPLDIFSCEVAPVSSNEVFMTDGYSYNYNGHDIPRAALKAMVQHPKLASLATVADVDLGRVSGMIFVSERTNKLETLHIALSFSDSTASHSSVTVFNFAEIYDEVASRGVRMEDSGCIAGDYLIYVSTKDDPTKVNPLKRRQPWTAVYRTHLMTGKTDRLTPPGEADLSPSVSPSGKKIAVASFQYKEGGWTGEIEHLMTDIVVMDLEAPFARTLVIKDGGWPSWGSDNVLFFHRRINKGPNDDRWRVYRSDIRKGPSSNPLPVTPEDIYFAMTPAAIDESRVAVATIRKKTKLEDINNLTVRTDASFYRHIEIFDSNRQQPVIQVTQTIKPLADHYNPFVIEDMTTDAGYRIGYHRCNRNQLESGQVSQQFDKIKSPEQDVGVFRVSGVFPTFSSDGKKLAFVDNDFRNIWLADSKSLRIVYTSSKMDSFFSPVWNQDPRKDTLYVCTGHAFRAREAVDVCAIPNVSLGQQKMKKLTKGKLKKSNNAFPSTSPDGKRLVYRSTRDWVTIKTNTKALLPKNLYIMENAEEGEYGRGEITRLTEGDWVDTHCQWSPNGDWIVFSSTRDKPAGAPPLDHGLDPGYYAIYLVNANRPNVVVRVMGSGNDLAGHVNHPFFSPDGRSLVVAADLAAVSVDPISLPIFLHSVRPYGDIFSIDINTNDITKNKDTKNIRRITHTRYENSTPNWTMFTAHTSAGHWSRLFNECQEKAPGSSTDEAESWYLTGHLCIGQRCC